MRFQIFLILFLLLFSACGKQNFTPGDARKAIMAGPQEILEKEDIDVVYVTKIGESSAVAESRVKTAFRLQKVDGVWTLKDIRIGHGQWETIENLATALNRVKNEETHAFLGMISTAVREYRKDTGGTPVFKDYIGLTDILAPQYLDPLIRLDSWRRPFRAVKESQDSILVISAGPDGLFDTEDDLSITITP